MKRAIPFILLTLVTLGVGAILLRHSGDSEVSLRAVGEVAGEVMQNVDRVGQRVVRISAAEEREIGRELARSVSYRTVADERRRAYLREVGGLVARHARRTEIDYRFEILEDEEVNAFALPGGHIFITTGLLALVTSEAQLAGVLGHEISHVDLRHCVERLQYSLAARKVAGPLVGVAVDLGYEMYERAYSEQQEAAADEGGIRIAMQAGYDPRETILLMRRMGDRFGEHEPAKARSPGREAGRVVVGAVEDYLQTHPPFRQRIAHIEKAARRSAPRDPSHRWYIGRSNYRLLVARTVREMPEEFTAPGL